MKNIRNLMEHDVILFDNSKRISEVNTEMHC